MPDLSIVIVNWNTSALLVDCLTSLRDSPLWPELDVIVVDNASTDDSRQRVREHFAEVRLIENRDNVGFARANNQALRVARGRYQMLLNSDTRVPPETLPGLVAFMDAHPEAGACGPRLVLPDGTPQAYAFGGDPTLGYLLARGFHRLAFDRPLHDWAAPETAAVDWVSGACLLARREAIEQVGDLDENIFMYFEDNDWCLRIRQAGWKIYEYPAVRVIHLGGQSLKRNPAAQSAYGTSLRYFFRKHYSRLDQLCLRALLPLYGRLRA